MSRPRDGDRSRVYRAEIEAHAGTLADADVGLDALRTLAGVLFADSWWRATTRGAVPQVTASRADATHSVAARRRDGTWVIRIAPGHAQAPTLSHEAAHVLCDEVSSDAHPPHGSSFRAAHLAVTGLLLGPHGERLLATSYRAHGLDWLDVPAWPRPPLPLDDHGIFGRWRTAIAL